MELEKKYVPVTVHFDANGKMRPIEIEFDEMRRYHIDKILDIRVVTGNLAQFSTVNAVHPAVADVYCGDASVRRDKRGDKRCSHSAQAFVRCGFLIHGGIRGGDRFFEKRRPVGHSGVKSVFNRSGIDAAGKLACNISAVRPSHSVADGQKAEFSRECDY